MTTSTVGLIAGLLVAVAAAIGGVSAAIVAILLGAVGYLVGGHFDGEFDFSQIMGRRDRG